MRILRSVRRAVFDLFGVEHRPWSLEENLIFIDVVLDYRNGETCLIGGGDRLGILAVRKGAFWVPVNGNRPFTTGVSQVLDREIIAWRPVKVKAGLQEFQNFEEVGRKWGE